MAQAVVIQYIDDVQYRDYVPGQVVDFPADILAWLLTRKQVNDAPAAVAAAIAGGAVVLTHSPGAAPRIVDAGLTACGLLTICESYERCKEKNPRTQSVRSVQLVADTIYADTAALQAAFPSAANNNRGGKVGTAGAYVIQTSDGTAWTTPAAGVMGYLLTGVSTAGYATAVPFTAPGLANGVSPPASGGAQMLKPFRLYGAIPFGNNGIQANSLYTLAGARGQSGTARVRIPLDEPEPILQCGGDTGAYLLNIDLHDGNNFRAVIDPSITTNIGNPVYIVNQAFTGAAGPGLLNVKLDVSQLGGFGRRKRTLEIHMTGDMTLTSLRIKPVSSYFQPPASPRIWWLADSLGGTVYLGNMRDAYPPLAQDFLGVPDICLDSEGGTGFVNKGSGNAGRNHAEKIAALSAIPQYANPDLIVIQSSANDNDVAGITAAAVTAINAALAAVPNVPVVVFGPTSRVGAVEQARSITTENAVKAAVDQVASARVLWIPMMTDTPQFIRGSGTINAPAGDGNADLMFNSGDLIHWVREGHLIAARDYVVPKLVAALRNYIG